MPTLTTKITGSNNYFSLISLNINGLNSPIKRHRLTNWLHKQDPTFCCLQETHLREKDRHYLRMKGWKTIFQANGMKKQAGVAILISDNIDFQPKVIKKRQGGALRSHLRQNPPRGTLNSEYLCSILQGQSHSLKKL
jgi:exonuclease III